MERKPMITFEQYIEQEFTRIEKIGGHIESTEFDGIIYTQISIPGMKTEIKIEDEFRAEYKVLCSRQGVTA
jgi:hypothetical protein